MEVARAGRHHRTVATLPDVGPPVGARSRQYGLLDPRLPPEETKVLPRTDGPLGLLGGDAHSDHERQRHRADKTRAGRQEKCVATCEGCHSASLVNRGVQKNSGRNIRPYA